MHSQRLGDLATVVGVVREQPHQDGLSRVELNLAIDLAVEFVLEHRRRPSIETVLDDGPGGLERGNELARLTWVREIVLPAIAAGIVERRAFGARLLENMAEPVGADRGGVRAMAQIGQR